MISLPILLCVVYPIVLAIYFASCYYQNVKIPQIPEKIRVGLAAWINIMFLGFVVFCVAISTFRSLSE